MAKLIKIYKGLCKINNSYDSSLEMYSNKMYQLINNRVLVGQINRIDELVLKIVHSENDIDLDTTHVSEIDYMFDNMRLNLKHNLYEYFSQIVQGLESLLFELKTLNHKSEKIDISSVDQDTFFEIMELQDLLRKLIIKFETFSNTSRVYEMVIERG